MARYLVTGCAGFIGSWITHALVERGKSVCGLDNFATGSRKNIAPMLDKMDFHEADLRDPDAVLRACEGVDYILHQGALPSVPLSIKDPRTSHDVNMNGTFNLLEAARAQGVKRVIYAASSSAYGNQQSLPHVETMTTMPISPYAVQKLTGELYMRSYWQVYGLETVCLRYFNIFGPRQAPNSPYSGVIAKFTLQMMRGQRPTIFGDGEQGRDFTYVENAVSANLKALEAPAERVAGRVFNVACGGHHTLKEIFSVLSRLLDFKEQPLFGPPRNGDIKDSFANISAAYQAFGYDPQVTFEDGMRRTVEWYKQEYSAAV